LEKTETERELKQMINKTRVAFLVLGFIPLGVLFAQSTVSTPIVGFEKKNFSGGTTGIGMGFVKPALVSGVSTGITSSSVTMTGANFAPNLGPVNGLPVYYYFGFINRICSRHPGKLIDYTDNRWRLKFDSWHFPQFYCKTSYEGFRCVCRQFCSAGLR